MSNNNNIDKILKRSGTGQEQRFIDALNPETFQLYDFDVEDWILFAYNFAENVNYFNVNNADNPSGDWQPFFKSLNLENITVPDRETREYSRLKESISSLLSQYKDEKNLTPHLTLFVCFLQLLEFSKKRFNGLTKRHLDFYYKDILQVDKKAPTPDDVHVIFELAKKSSEEQIKEDTALNAKKDVDDNPRVYKTKEELIVNKASVASLKTVYNGLKDSDPNFKGNNPAEFKASSIANSLDGLGEELTEESPYWYPFGYTSAEDDFAELEDANIGFAIASPMLGLNEGLRTVEITINFFEEKAGPNKNNINDFTPAILKEILSIKGSGEKGWIEGLKLKTEVTPQEEAITLIPSNQSLKLVFQLSKDTDALVNYNEEKLLNKYNTQYPLINFSVDTSNQNGYNFYRAIVNRIVEKITIKVKVKDAKALLLENDSGVLKTTKPFFPFTPRPVKSSNFYIDYPEVFSKNWSSINVNLKWKSTPEDFKDWYEAYETTQRLATRPSAFITQVSSADPDEQTKAVNPNLIVQNNAYFKAEKALLHKENWSEEAIPQVLFTKIIDPETNEATEDFESNIVWTNNSIFQIDKAGPMRLSLQQTFLHELYPRIYALSLTSEGDPLIPNEPYTPVVETIALDYVAEESIFINSQALPINNAEDINPSNTKGAYDFNRIKLFHNHPFGEKEEHNYLKMVKQAKGIKDQYDTNSVNTFLLPKYCKGGVLYVGLENAEVLQTVSLLVQVLEGSENPTIPSFNENEKIEWSVLCDNKWKDLKDYIISNNTDNFLTSGIVKISIPKEATQDNTELPSGLIWLRAKMHRDYDAVCKAINIHSQAVLATFNDDNNNLSHLEKGLPAETIKKLITRKPQIKSVAQPYNSFNGIPEESDALFYRRISERLRHKNRAITLWDYEHLVLQKFPEIYKVKCLNHTTENSFIAAGDVMLVVVPDTVNKNVFDIYEPRLSRAVMNKVENYLNALNTMHVTAKVINPNYEKVTITLEAKFYEGLDESFYTQKLEVDIIKFLSPWAFDDAKEVEFGITLHRSVLIDYLEKLEYVDYLQNVSMDKDGVPSNSSITPLNPKSILVSAKKHNISTVLTTCKGEKIEEKIECKA